MQFNIEAWNFVRLTKLILGVEPPSYGS